MVILSWCLIMDYVTPWNDALRVEYDDPSKHVEVLFLRECIIPIQPFLSHLVWNISNDVSWAGWLTPEVPHLGQQLEVETTSTIHHHHHRQEGKYHHGWTYFRGTKPIIRQLSKWWEEWCSSWRTCKPINTVLNRHCFMGMMVLCEPPTHLF